MHAVRETPRRWPNIAHAFLPPGFHSSFWQHLGNLNRNYRASRSAQAETTSPVLEGPREDDRDRLRRYSDYTEAVRAMFPLLGDRLTQIPHTQTRSASNAGEGGLRWFALCPLARLGVRFPALARPEHGTDEFSLSRGFAALGLFTSLFIEELPLAKEVDVTWGLDLPHPPSPPDSPRPSSLHPRTSLPTSRRSSLAVLPETFRRRSSVATHWPPLEVPLGRRPSSTTELEAPAVGGRRRSSVERIVSFAHWMVGAGVPVAEALGALGGRERRGSAETRRSGSKRREPSLAGY